MFLLSLGHYTFDFDCNQIIVVLNISHSSCCQYYWLLYCRAVPAVLVLVCMAYLVSLLWYRIKLFQLFCHIMWFIYCRQNTVTLLLISTGRTHSFPQQGVDFFMAGFGLFYSILWHGQTCHEIQLMQFKMCSPSLP